MAQPNNKESTPSMVINADEQETQALLNENECNDTIELTTEEEEEPTEEDEEDEDEIKITPFNKRMRVSSTEEPPVDYTKSIVDCSNHIDYTICGRHTHIEDGKHMACYNLPWGKTTLAEAKALKEGKMYRKDIWIKRIHQCFLKNGKFSIHFVLTVFKRFNVDVAAEVKEIYSQDMIMVLLENPQYFNYNCITVCDCEILRKMIFDFLGLQWMTTVHIEQIEKNVNKCFEKRLQKRVQVLLQDTKRVYTAYYTHYSTEKCCVTCQQTANERKGLEEKEKTENEKNEKLNSEQPISAK